MIDRMESVRMIRDSVGAIASPTGDLRRIRALRTDSVGIERAVWQRIVELGWLALLVDEDSGGLGLGARELAAIGEELGAALIPEPVIAVAAMMPLLDRSIRERVLSGTMIVVPAWRETIVGLDETPRTVAAGGTVTGCKILVANVAAADAFVVTTASGAVMVERDAPGVAFELYRMVDGGQSGTLTMIDAPCTTLDGDVRAALHGLALAHCGYLLGAAERAFAMTLGYLAIRKQFGRLIGSFQVLQHRAAEAKIQLALSRAVLDEAIGDVERQADRAEQLRSGSRALARVSDTAMLIAREAVQMHGAIGITDENDIGLYCRKILSIYNQFGTASANRSRYLASLHPEMAA